MAAARTRASASRTSSTKLVVLELAGRDVHADAAARRGRDGRSASAGSGAQAVASTWRPSSPMSPVSSASAMNADGLEQAAFRMAASGRAPRRPTIRPLASVDDRAGTASVSSPRSRPRRRAALDLEAVDGRAVHLGAVGLRSILPQALRRVHREVSVAEQLIAVRRPASPNAMPMLALAKTSWPRDRERLLERAR